jgi:hypothetical protein
MRTAGVPECVFEGDPRKRVRRRILGASIAKLRNEPNLVGNSGRPKDANDTVPLTSIAPSTSVPARPK